jgi:NADP-dependent 3-hydroxy acid dehydrogenase YdfG
MRQAADRLAQRLAGKRAIVTGAASGLGLAFTRRLSAGGWTLGLMDRNAAELASVRHSLNSIDNTVHTYHVDIADADAMTSAIGRFAQTERGLDLMINNAGVAAGGDFLATPLSDWRWIIDINLLGIVHGCRAALPHMLGARLGQIINIASAAGFACSPSMSAYNVTKAGVIALSETLMAEFAGDGIRVSVAMPGFFPTNLLKDSRTTADAAALARRLMARSTTSADEVAEAILLAAARGETHIVLPREYRMLWRYKRWAPRRFVRMFAKLRRRTGP